MAQPANVDHRPHVEQNRRLLRDIKKAFGLWRVWIFLGARDVRARYRRSFFGPLWILINSVVFVIAVGGVYGLLFNQPMSHFLPNIMAGFVIWAFINATLIDGGGAFTSAEGYIKQFAYPKQVYLLRSWFSNTIVLAVSLAALLALLIALNQLSWRGLIYAAPGVLLLLVTGLLHTTVSAHLTARFRDLPHIFSSFMQILFYLTPVIYPKNMLESKGFALIYEVNPFYHLIDIVRVPLLTQTLATPFSYKFMAIYLLCQLGVTLIIVRRTNDKVVFWL